MVTPSAGSVVLIPFPFSDLSRSKLRPAVAIAEAGHGDWIMSQITSKPYSDPRAIPLSDADFQTGSLQVASFARPVKLFTAHQGLIISEVGRLQTEALNRIIDAVVSVLKKK